MDIENELMETVKKRKVVLLEHLKENSLDSDKDLMDKLSHVFKANGDLYFKKGINYVSNLILTSLSKLEQLKIHNEIPYNYIEESGQNSKVTFYAYKEDITEDEARELQFACGYPDNIFGFYHFKLMYNEIYTWQCDKTIRD